MITEDRKPETARRPAGDECQGGILAGMLGNSGASVCLQFTEVFLQFGILLLLARGLGVASFGNYMYAITLVTFLVIFGKLGLDVSAVRFVSAYLVDGRTALLRGYLRFAERTVFGTSAFIATLFALIVLTCAHLLPSDLVMCFLMASPLVIFMALLHVRGGVLRGFNRSVHSRIPQTLILPLLLLLGACGVLIVAPLSDHAAWIIILVQSGAAAIATFVAGRWIAGSRKTGAIAASTETSDAERQQWVVSGGLLLLLAGMSKLQAQIDILMLGAILETTEAGIYATASRIAGLPVLVLVATNMVIAPLCARLLENGKAGAIARLIRRSGTLVIVLALPLTLGLAIFGKPLLAFLGPEFTAGYVPLLILLVGRFAFVISGPAGVLLNMSGNEAVMAKTLAIGVLLNIILNMVLIPLYGSAGAAVATALSTILCRALLAGFVWRKLRVPCSIVQPATWLARGA